MSTRAHAPIDPAAQSAPRPARMARRMAIMAALAALLVALVVDRLYRNDLLVGAREHTRAQMMPYASALQRAVSRRVALLSGLRSFADSRASRRALDAEFPAFAQGTMLGTSGVRAVQLVESGRIVATWPLEGNEEALGYDLLRDPRPEIGGDVGRALGSGEVTVTGPISLVQGGSGLLVRQRLRAREGFPDLAAIVLDVPTIIAEAGIPSAASGLHLQALDRGGAWFGGDRPERVGDPEVIAIEVPDGDWSLLGAPATGWEAAIAPTLLAERLTAAALILVAGLLGFVLGGRADRLAREVEQSGTRLDLALRAGRMGAWEWDIAARRMVWSDAAAAIFGYGSRDVTGELTQVLDRVHDDDRETLRRAIDAMVRGERRQFVDEIRIVLDDDSMRWVLLIGEVERDETGAPVRLLGVVSDASERRELEERLRHAQRLEAVGTLAGGVAHDFNNLLTAIIGFTELALDHVQHLGDDERGEAIRGDLRQVMLTADRAATLTSQLLAFSRRKTTAPALVDLSSVVHDLEPMLRRLLGTGNELGCELTPGLAPVWVDSGQLTQVLLNLIVNARDAMPSGGRVVVRTMAVRSGGPGRPSDAPPGEWNCLMVEDTGTGMSPELQARVFEPYFTTKEVGRGTGLGLAVVYGAVENAGGQVTVRSAVGEGTTFCVYLPPRRTTGAYQVPLVAVSA